MLGFLKTIAIGAATLVATGAYAVPVAPNVWYEFTFGTPGTSLEDGAGGVPLVTPATVSVGDAPWTIDLAKSGTLLVADAFRSGDQFEVLDFGVPIGMTSLPVLGSNCGTDLSCALADLSFSRGVFALSAGLHSFTGAVLLSPFGGGAGAFIIRTPPVPLPAAAPLLLSVLAALGGLAALRRRI